MSSELRILVIISLILFSRCEGQNELLDKTMNAELQANKKTVQPDKTGKCHSVFIYEEVVPPMIIESNEPTDIILQNFTSDIEQAEIMEADADETEENMRNRRPGRIVVRVCNRRRRRRCRYVIVVRRARRRRSI